MPFPTRCLEPQALTVGLHPRIKPQKVGAVGRWHPTRHPHPPCLPWAGSLSRDKPSPGQLLSTSPSSLLLSLPFPLFHSQEKGFWLPLPGNQTGCHRLRRAAQMLLNEGAENEGAKSLSPVISCCQQRCWCSQITHFLKLAVVVLHNEKTSKVRQIGYIWVNTSLIHSFLFQI